MKMTIGSLLLATAYLVLVAAAWGDRIGGANWLWVLGFFVLLTIGELYISPIGLALVARVAPPSLRSTIMGLWLTTSFAGNFIAGWLGSFWSSTPKDVFFLIISAIAMAAAAAMFVVNRPLKLILVGRAQ
jgi:POT family proton-dependent oligopeptide transporter